MEKGGLRIIKSIIRKAFREPKLVLLKFLGLRIFRIIRDEIYLKLNYRIRIGKGLDLENPKSFNEKLQWLKLYDRRPEYTMMVDKYEVRKYIAEKIGEEYLIPLIGVYETVDEIDLDTLPNQFVIKCNHDSGSAIICKDKALLNFKEFKRKINKHLFRNFFWVAREWPYKNVKPRIICEKYMIDESGKELKDYKMLCFNGKVLCSFVCLNRNSEKGLNVDFYDIEWNPMLFERHYPRSNTIIPKPKTYAKMIELAEALSKGIPFVRVDFYEVDGHLYFGELTFYPGSGFEEFTPESFDYLLGSWLTLPKRTNT